MRSATVWRASPRAGARRSSRSMPSTPRSRDRRGRAPPGARARAWRSIVRSAPAFVGVFSGATAEGYVEAPADGRAGAGALRLACPPQHPPARRAARDAVPRAPSGSGREPLANGTGADEIADRRRRRPRPSRRRRPRCRRHPRVRFSRMATGFAPGPRSPRGWRRSSPAPATGPASSSPRAGSRRRSTSARAWRAGSPRCAGRCSTASRSGASTRRSERRCRS